MRNTFILFLLFCFCSSLPVDAQKRRGKAKTPVVTLTPEQQAAKALAERRAAHAAEMMENVQKITFIDSLVVDKDNFLSRLRLTQDAGSFTDPHRLFSDADAGRPRLGAAAFVGSMSNIVLFSAETDSTAVLRLHAAHRSGDTWSLPEPLTGMDIPFDRQDYPFLLADGLTLYFAAEGEESIGGLDLFVTRYNQETRQYVRPENVGFPFNSPDNDYLLAIDDVAKIGVLVTDRRQPDDKVCLYWFIPNDTAETYTAEEEDDGEDDDEDDDAEIRLQRFACIACIADTQTDPEAMNSARERWASALAADAASNVRHYRFVINDDVVYTTLDQFRSPAARTLAAQWMQDVDALQELEDSQERLRADYALTRSNRTQSQLLNLETQIAQLRQKVNEEARNYRQLELKK